MGELRSPYYNGGWSARGSPLALGLLMFWVFADHPRAPGTLDDLALVANFFDAWSNFQCPTHFARGKLRLPYYVLSCHGVVLSICSDT